MNYRKNSEDQNFQDKYPKSRSPESEYSQKSGKDQYGRSISLIEPEITPNIPAEIPSTEYPEKKSADRKNQPNPYEEVPPKKDPGEISPGQEPDQIPTRKKMENEKMNNVVSLQSHSIFNDIKTTVNDLTAFFTNFSPKKNEQNASVKEILENLGSGFEKIKGDLTHLFTHLSTEGAAEAVGEIVKSTAIPTSKKQWEKFLSMCEEKWDGVKSFVKSFLQRIKNLPKFLQDVFTLQILKLKLVALEVRIFLLEKRNAMMLKLA